MLAEIRKRAALPGTGAVRAIGNGDGLTEQINIETEPGLMISGTLFHRLGSGHKPAVLLVDGTPALAEELARDGNVVLSLTPRGLPADQPTLLLGDAYAVTYMFGRSAGMRTGDIILVSTYCVRSDVDANSLYAVARGSGRMAVDGRRYRSRISRIWLDRRHTACALRSQSTGP
jgi:hypothetical protein